jgi:hypothetical protein
MIMIRIKLSNKVLEKMYQEWIIMDTYDYTAQGFITYFLTLGWDINFDANVHGYTILEQQSPFFLLKYSQ